MNTNANTVNTDANNEVAKTLADMFAGVTVPDFRLTRGEATVHADNAHIEPDSTRPRR